MEGGTIEEFIPTTFLTIMVILYPFYCFNALWLGRNVVIVLMIVIITYSIWKNGIKGFLSKFTPGIFVFLLICIAVILITMDNFVWLWDETRLWGAVPKALYYTHKLQLGEYALTYRNMQSYPPGMPLLVFFLESFSHTFREWQIYMIYGVFAASLILPAIKRLKWSQWFLFVPITVFIVALPCIATSNGGDLAYFYNSLFIDAVIGAVFGYGLFLASTVIPDDNGGIYRIVVTIIALVLLKDSGILFAECVLLTFTAISWNKRKRAVSTLFIGQMMILATYYTWQLLLDQYNVKNHVGLHVGLTWNAIKALIVKMCTVPMFYYRRGPIEIRLTFVLAMVFLILISTIIAICAKDISRQSNLIVVVVILVATVVFGMGFVMAFGERLPSYERYFTTITYAYLLYVSMRIIFVLTKIDICASGNEKKVLCWCLAILSLITCDALLKWEATTDMRGYCPLDEATLHSETIKAAVTMKEKEQVDVYLLYPGEPSDNCILAQRIYMNLIGTGVRIKNDYSEMSIAEVSSYNNVTEQEIVALADKWKADVYKNYDYIYVVKSDEITDNALEYAIGYLPKASEIIMLK